MVGMKCTSESRICYVRHVEITHLPPQRKKYPIVGKVTDMPDAVKNLS
jgi:hypothetical protein